MFAEEAAGDTGQESRSGLAFRSGTINPRWVEIPILYALSRSSGASSRALVPAGRPRSSSSAANADNKKFPRLDRRNLG